MTARGTELGAPTHGDLAPADEVREPEGRSAGKPGRLRRWLIILGCALLLLAGLGYVGYRSLLTTQWGVLFPLFADDERAEHFRTMAEIFPSRDITAGSSVWEIGRDERDLPAWYDLEGQAHDLAAFLDLSETTGLGVLAAVLGRATGQPVASHPEVGLWQPAGMEDDASWSLDRTDPEIGFRCMNAPLRDSARFGQLDLDDGVRDGQRILPAGWVEASTNPEAPRLEPGDNPDSSWTFGYGYRWWIPEGRVHGEFTAIGVWGQYVYVDPTTGVVIAKSSTDGAFDANDHESIAAFRAIAEEIAR